MLDLLLAPELLESQVLWITGLGLSRGNRSRGSSLFPGSAVLLGTVEK